eukprot:6179363-Pleurochrysis_carterae.AAC.1
MHMRPIWHVSGYLSVGFEGVTRVMIAYPCIHAGAACSVVTLAVVLPSPKPFTERTDPSVAFKMRGSHAWRWSSRGAEHLGPWEEQVASECSDDDAAAGGGAHDGRHSRAHHALL